MDAFGKPWSGIGVGGSPAADFVNTLDWRLRGEPVELLREFADLLRWGRSAGVLPEGEAESLREWGAAHPVLAARALARAVAVREGIAAVFAAVTREETIPAGALDAVDEACREAWGARGLRPAGDGLAWGWRDRDPSPDRVVWEAALDAARILTGPARERLRQCGDFECGWFFLDTSKNRSRRWCTMKGCGNRNKARTHYRKSARRSGG